MRVDRGFGDAWVGRIEDVEGRGGMLGGSMEDGEDDMLGVEERIWERWLRISGSGTRSMARWVLAVYEVELSVLVRNCVQCHIWSCLCLALYESCQLWDGVRMIAFCVLLH